MNDTAPVDLKLEVVILPVADVDRAKRFYAKLGWREDADFAFDNGFRVVQFTPPGSACSIQFGDRLTSAAPGSVHDTYLVVSDIAAARDDLGRRGAEVSEAFHPVAPGAQFEPNKASGRQSGAMPEQSSYRSFFTFSDPDGNGWLVQEIKARLPGRGVGNLDVASLVDFLHEAEVRHGEYSAAAPKHHWSDWYGAYIVARQRGRSAEEAVQDAGTHMDAVLR